jgi:general secretion pathway protein C
MTMLYYVGSLYAALLAVMLAVVATSAIKYVLTPQEQVSVPRVATQAVTDSLRAETAEALVERNLFGIDIAEARPNTTTSDGGGGGPVDEEGFSPAVNFRGKLTGIIMSSDPAKHRVIITVDKDVYVLSVDVPKEGYTLKAVAQNYAVIRYGGADYKLMLDEDIKPAAKPAGEDDEKPASKPQAPQGTEGADGTLNFTLERGELMDKLKDINTVLRSLLVSPTYVDGEFQGYRVTRMSNDSPMRALGLQQGDIINRINGEDLTSPEILFGMLGNVDNIDAVSVDITRNGQKRTLFVEIQ